MVVRCRWLLLLPLAAVLASSGETFVIAAGVEQYDDARISSLRYAVADAEAVAEAFRAAGVRERNLLLLTSADQLPERRPSRAILLAALEHVAEHAETGDRFILFFAGHGVEAQGQRYLLPVDTRRTMLAATALPLALVHEALRGLKAREVLFVVDACRNDPDAGRGDTDARMTDGLVRALGPVPASDETGARPLAATLLSCDVGQRSWEDPPNQHGAFTEQLLNGLRGEAAEPDGRVLLSRLAGYVRERVATWAQRADKQQTPTLLNPGGGDMVVLVRAGEPTVTIDAQRQPLSRLIAELGGQAGVPIALGKGVDGQLAITGRMDHLPLSRALASLTAAYGLTVRRVGEIYLLERYEPGTPGPDLVPDGAAELSVSPGRDGQCRTIAAALEHVSPGGLIRVKPGVYDEALLITQPVRIVGDGPRDEIVLAASSGPGLTLQSTGAEVLGLTFFQRPHPDGRPQAAIDVTRGRLTLDDCLVHGGTDGVLVHGWQAEALVRGSLLVGAVRRDVAVEEGARATISDCELRGGAVASLMVGDAANAALTGCAFDSTSDVAVYVLGGTATLDQCAFAGHNGVRCGRSESPGVQSVARVSDCTFANSFAVGRPLEAVAAGEVTAERCTIGNDQCEAAYGGRMTLRDCRFRHCIAMAAVKGSLLLERCQWESGPSGSDGSGACVQARNGGTVVCRGSKLGPYEWAVSARTGSLVTIEDCDLRAARKGAVTADPDCTIVRKGTVQE